MSRCPVLEVVFPWPSQTPGHPMPSGGGDAAPPARRPCGAALPGPQPSPALGASFLSGFLREPEPEEAAAGLSESLQMVVRPCRVFLHRRGLPFQSHSGTLRGPSCPEEEPQGGPEPSCPARPPAGPLLFPEAKQAASS